MKGLTLGQFARVGVGVRRPEDVAIDADGRVFASDERAAIAEILPDGRVQQHGRAGGRPNGINLDLGGRMVIANMDLACAQVHDFSSGRTTILANRVGEQPLTHSNYPLVDSAGGVWISCCTRQPDVLNALATSAPDGFIVRLDPDGTVVMVAESVRFPNCMAFDASEDYLYVARTGECDVRRFHIRADGSLGPEEAYGPPLGLRGPDERGPRFRTDIQSLLSRWGLADGIAFDAEGNLWVTMLNQNRIVAITPDLEVEEVVPETGGAITRPTSVTWGGDDMRDVYIGSTTTDYVTRARSNVPGLPSVAQKIGIRAGLATRR